MLKKILKSKRDELRRELIRFHKEDININTLSVERTIVIILCPIETICGASVSWRHLLDM
jgi:hypothetical protein